MRFGKLSGILGAGTLLGATLAFGSPPSSPVGAATIQTGGTCAAQIPTRQGDIFGIQPPVPGSGTSSSTCSTNDLSATAPSPSYMGDPPLTQHGGPVMGTTSAVTVTPIYWAPAGYGYPTTYQSLTGQFLTDVGRDSGLLTNVFSDDDQYTSASGVHIAYDVVTGSPINDADPYPTSGGCTPDTGAVYPDATGYTACVTDSQVKTELTSILSAHGLTSNLSHLYVIFLAKGAESCFGTTNDAQGGKCTLSAAGGDFCAYHSSVASGSGQSVYANIPYAISDIVDGLTCTSSGGRLVGGLGVGNQSPNGNLDADTAISETSHEMNEAITDPEGNAWYDSGGNEVADDCAYTYGDSSTFGGTSGSEFNETINGDHYFIQLEFSNQEFAVNPSDSCIQMSQLQTSSFTSTPPASPKVGGTYVVTATATSGLPVALTVDSTSTSICSLNGSTSGSTVTFKAKGKCTLDANQVGNEMYVPAPEVQQVVTVASSATNGTGTLVVTPTSVVHASKKNTLTFTYTAANAVNAGQLNVIIPAGWSAPSLTHTAAGYTTSTCGAVVLSGTTVKITPLTLASGSTCAITYGSKASGGTGAHAPASATTSTFSAKEKSTSGGTMTALAVSPKVTVT